VNPSNRFHVSTTFTSLTPKPGDVVASHFSTIGLRVRSEEEMNDLIGRMGPVAEPLGSERGTYFRWADPSGAEMWIQVDNENQLLGANPHFAGKSAVRVGLTARRDSGSPSANFVWCLVDALGGAFDVVIDPELMPQLPRVGGVIQGSFWLSGRILGA
jgi:hypothetical protein